MAGVCRNKGIKAIAINGISNHVHALIHLPPSIALAEASISSNPIRHAG
jgi:REP element-mobilizing transposase RayT